MSRKEINTGAVARILVVDDEPGIRDMLAHELSILGYRVDSVSNGLEAIQKITVGKYEVAICDLNMPKLGGLEALAELHRRDPDLEVIMMTGYATVETAVEAMKKGAYDFVQKPFNLDELLALVSKSLEKGEFRRTIRELRETKKKLQETQNQLIQSEKLAGIGRLAAGVAHELNNPLSGVLGFAQLLLDDNTLSGQQRNDIETICTQSRRCRAIVQNLLQFSRRKEPAMETLDLRHILKSTIDLVKYDFSTSGIEIVTKMPEKFPEVRGDPNQLQQVFLNLITNARQAMEGHKLGKLMIDCGTERGTAFVRFKDEGPGIPHEILDKIFDPFFTTKPQGKGTGLGLSICYGIMQQHQGNLKVNSEPAAGAVFTVELPVPAGTGGDRG